MPSTKTFPRSLSPLEGLNLGIVLIGDNSLVTQKAGLFSGAEMEGFDAAFSLLDEHWDGTEVGVLNAGVARKQMYPLADGISTALTSNDDYASAPTDMNSLAARLLRILRTSYPLQLNRIRVANLAIAGSSFFTWAGEQALGFFDFGGQPPAGQFVNVDDTFYTFSAAPAAFNEVLIGADAIATANNLRNAINGEGAGFFPGTPRNLTVYCPTSVVAPFTELALCYAESGVVGNGKPLAGNAGGQIQVSQPFQDGSAVSAVMSNGEAVVPASFGNVDYVVIWMGNSEAARPGYRCRRTQLEATRVFNHVLAHWPDCHIICATPVDSGDAATHAGLAVGVPGIAAAAAACTAPARVSIVEVYSFGTQGPGGLSDSLMISSTGYATNLAQDYVCQMVAREIASRSLIFV